MTGSYARLVASLPLALAAAAVAWGAGAQARQAEASESRAVLEQVCRDQGTDASTCGCLGDFVVANFSPRELEGAALVFSDPQLASDPGAAIGALLEEGYTIEEITAVSERIASLEQAATTACDIDEGDG